MESYTWSHFFNFLIKSSKKLFVTVHRIKSNSDVTEYRCHSSLHKKTISQRKYHVSDAEILEIFNGMTGTMRSKDATIDEQIKETNKCYNMYPVVRMKRVLRKYVYSSWKFLAVFASMLLILMMGLQSFCNLHGCPPAFTTAKKA
ncbi:hypothetical protein SLE2022_033320 [Rubroshorea leprosula]